MSDELVTIANFGSPVEAGLARSVLEDAEIPAYLEGEVTGGTLWHVGTALGGVKLQVAEADVERALAALEAFHEGGDDAQAGEVESADEFGPEAFDESEDEDESEDDDVEVSDPDELLARAWRAALIGVFLAPPLLNCYSASLLVTWRKQAPGPTRWSGKAIGTALLDAIVIGGMVFLVVGWMVLLHG